MCTHVEDFVKEMNELPQWGGYGSNRFEVSINMEEITFYDGWNSYPILKLNFCPVCGEKLEKEK